MSGCCPRVDFFGRCRTFGGRAGTVPRRPRSLWKLFGEAEPVSNPSPGGERRVCRNTSPTCIALPQLRGYLKDCLLKKLSCVRQMLATEKVPGRRHWGKKPWRGAFALALEASGQTVAGNAVSAGLDSRGCLLCLPMAHEPPGTQSWSPPPPDCLGRARFFESP